MKEYIISLFVTAIMMVFSSTAAALEIYAENYPLSESDRRNIEDLIRAENTGSPILRISISIPEESAYGNKIAQIIIVGTNNRIIRTDKILYDRDSIHALLDVIEETIKEKTKKESEEKIREEIEGKIPVGKYKGRYVEEIKVKGRYLLGWKIGEYYILVWQKEDKRVFWTLKEKYNLVDDYTSLEKALVAIPDMPKKKIKEKPKQKK